MTTRTRRPIAPLALAAASLLVATACGPGETAPDTVTVERDTVGDTIVVRNHGVGLWGDSARLVEELRIGRTDGDEDYLFGQVFEMAVAPSGNIYVWDGAMRSVRAYGDDGRFLRAVGREGAGPGEFREVVGMADLPDGRLLLRDPGAGRIVAYDADGEPAGAWPLPSGLYTSDALVTDTAGYAYARILTAPIVPGEPWPLGYARLDGSGEVVDTIPRPRWAGEIADPATFEPHPSWRWHPHGYMVGTPGDRYAVYLFRPGEPVTRVERADQSTVPVPPAERSELDALFAERDRQRPAGAGVPARRPTPAAKAAIRTIMAGRDGRIWVRPYMPSVERDAPVDTTLPPERRPRRWTEPAAWDVFEPDGTFLGRVHVPERATVMVVRGDRAWGTVRDADDVPFVVRWRIEHGAAGDGG